LIPPNILILSPSLSAVSGVSSHVNQLLNADLLNEFRFVHFQVGSEGRNERPVTKVLRLIGSIFQFPAALVRERIDIVHLNTSMDFKGYWRDIAYLLWAKVLGKKVVYQTHAGADSNHFFKKDGFSFLKKWLLGLPDAVILLSNIEKGAAEGFCRFKRLQVIPNAIDLESYSEIHPKEFNDDTLTLGFISRLTGTKGIFESIEAIATLRSRGIKNLRLVVAGSGPDEALIRKKVNDLKLDNQVHILGSIFGEKKLAFWSEIEILLFPTYHQEGLPYVILESLASGTPLVTTEIGGIPDAVENGVQGVIVPPKNVNALADAIESLISDREKLRVMSFACREKAQNQYSIDRLAKDFSAVYRVIA